jgi:hypothetical protein
MNSINKRQLKDSGQADLSLDTPGVKLSFDNTTVDLLISLTLYLLNETATPAPALDPDVQTAAAQSIGAISQLYATANSSSINRISTASQGWMPDLLRALGNSSVGVEEFNAQVSSEAIAAKVEESSPSDHETSTPGLSIGFVGVVASVATISLAMIAIGIWLRSRRKSMHARSRAPASISQLNIMDRAWSALPTPPRPVTTQQYPQVSPTRTSINSARTPDFDGVPPQRKSAARRLTQI